MSARIVCGDLIIDSNEIKDIKIIEEPEVLSYAMRDMIIDVKLLRHTFDDIAEHKDDVFVLQYGRNAEMKMCIVSYKQTSKNLWEVEFGNYVSICEKHDFHGDVYDEKDSRELVFEIFEKAGFHEGDFLVDETIFEASPTFTGYIPYTTCKEALRQTLFVLGAMATTENGVPKIISSTNAENKNEIPQNRTLENVKVESANDGRYDSVNITTHNYNHYDDIKVIYDNTFRHVIKDEVHELKVVFDAPYWDLEIVGTTSTTISSVHYTLIESSANHVVISWQVKYGNANAYITIRGRSYNPITKEVIVKSENGTQENTLQIDDITLINDDNAEAIANRCLDAYSGSTQAVAKVVIGKHVIDDGVVIYDNDVNCGDIVTVPTDYQGTYTGRVIKEQYNLNGNIVIKEITVK